MAGRCVQVRQLAVAVLALATLAVAGGASADSSASGAAGTPSAVHVKFRAGSEVRLRNGELRSLGTADLAAVAAVLGRMPVERIERLFSQSEQELELDRQRIERRSGRPLPDLNLWFRIRLADEPSAGRVAVALRALPIVETAYVEPPPPPVPSTPSFVHLQGYRLPAPTGIDAAATAAVPGARGSNIKVVDIEYSWNETHEDLTKAVGALIPNGTPTDPFNNRSHGTAVLSVLVGDDNAFGVTGLVADAAVAMVNAEDNHAYDLADAINIARQNMSPGDVMLLEQQAPGMCPTCWVPVEWFSAFYDAIKTATAAGIIVVEAAGNGTQDLDLAAYGSPFPAGRADSGAIIVGAGFAPAGTCVTTPPPPPPGRSRVSSSTYGSRVNLQGWGGCIAAAGYGVLQGGDENVWYTDRFGGTSGAAPIAAAAAASLASAREAVDPGHPLTSTEARMMLMNTGTAQDTASPGALAGNIGPLPNLAAALAIVNPTFVDVPTANPFYAQIERLYDLGITTGCGTNGSGQLIFCPGEPVPRQQMAAFLVRAKGLSQLTPATPTFADVPASNPFYGYVERLFEQGITTGCGTNGGGALIFCPGDFVPRQQMAAFLVRAKGLTQLASPTPTFADVPASNPFYGWIERLYAEGITTGCGTNAAGQRLYCPGEHVPRQQMAAFLVRAFGG